MGGVLGIGCSPRAYGPPQRLTDLCLRKNLNSEFTPA